MPQEPLFPVVPPARAWLVSDGARPASARGASRFLRSNFEPGRRFANELDFQHQFDGWCDKVNQRLHRSVRAVPAEPLERARMRPLPSRLPDLDRRLVTRVPQQPYLRVDRNDYSLDPAFAGRRVELRVSQTHVTAVVLDTGELACRHRACTPAASQSPSRSMSASSSGCAAAASVATSRLRPGHSRATTR